MRILLSLALSGLGLVSGSSVETPSESPEIGGTVDHLAIAIDEETTPGPVTDEAANSGTTTHSPSTVIEVVGDGTDPLSGTVSDIVLDFNSTSTTIQPEPTAVSSEIPNVDSGASTDTGAVTIADTSESEGAPVPQAVDNQVALENATENLRLDVSAINDGKGSVDGGDETEGDAAVVVDEEEAVVEEYHADLPDSLTAFPYVDETSTTTVAPESEQSTGMII